MTPRIELIKSKKLIGKHLRMSIADNKTGELWKSFMKERSVITNRINEDFISMQVYDIVPDFLNYDLSKEFVKWAVVEVADSEAVPDGMEAYELGGGLYAVFNHKGDASTFPETLHFIFGEWLPSSEYELDDREHFEVLGEKYRNNDPNSEEEIWIPIKRK